MGPFWLVLPQEALIWLVDFENDVKWKELLRSNYIFLDEKGLCVLIHLTLLSYALIPIIAFNCRV